MKVIEEYFDAFVNKDYFNFKATGLKIDQTYAIKFQWVYSDGTVSDWSPGKSVTTNTESVPSAPIASISACKAALSLSLAFLASSAIRLTAASSRLSSLIPISALPFFSSS